MVNLETFKTKLAVIEVFVDYVIVSPVIAIPISFSIN